jgi:ureidoglycolate hydrolase
MSLKFEVKAMVYEIQLKKITKSNFEHYGSYFDENGTDPTYSDKYFDWWNAVGIIQIEGRSSLGIVRPKSNPFFSEQVFEQHNNTPEVLIPLDEDVIILLGKASAFDTAVPSKDSFEAFLVPKGTAVSLNPGVWHHAPMVMSQYSRVMVLFKENTSFEDSIVKDLSSLDMTVKVKI